MRDRAKRDKTLIAGSHPKGDQPPAGIPALASYYKFSISNFQFSINDSITKFSNLARLLFRTRSGIQNRSSDLKIETLEIVWKLKIRNWEIFLPARVVEQADTQDLKSCGWIIRAGSTPAPGTKIFSVGWRRRFFPNYKLHTLTTSRWNENFE